MNVIHLFDMKDTKRKHLADTEKEKRNSSKSKQTV